jgi:hypothetical protein
MAPLASNKSLRFFLRGSPLEWPFCVLPIAGPVIYYIAQRATIPKDSNKKLGKMHTRIDNQASIPFKSRA